MPSCHQNPFWVIFLLFGLAASTFFLTWFLTNSNVAGLFLIVAVSYFLLYEWLHLLYHLPERSKLGGLKLIRALKRHHQAHHNPALMNDYNFNIAFPIWDWVRGTVYKKKTFLPQPGQAVKKIIPTDGKTTNG